MKKKLFFDCEFTELSRKGQLISIGFVTDTDEIFYAEISDFPKENLSDFVKENVIPNLKFSKMSEFVSIQEKHIEAKIPYEQLKSLLTKWFESFGCEFEVWSDCLSYDWMLFNDIFGTPFDVPSCIYYIPFDICTLMKAKGIDPDISREAFVQNSNFLLHNKVEKHNALFDSFIVRECYNKLMFYM